jgi:hypothetical protein
MAKIRDADAILAITKRMLANIWPCPVAPTPIATAGDIFDPNGDDVTAAKVAVDGRIEHRQVESAAFDLKFRRDRDQTCLGRSGGFAPVSFPSFHGISLGRRDSSLLRLTQRGHGL